MLPRFSVSETPQVPRITKEYDGKDATYRGAFPKNAVITFTARLPRTLASSALVMRIRRDNEAAGEEHVDGSARDLPFIFTSTDGVTDVYRLTLETAEICGEDTSALFYYEFIFPRGLDTLFSDSTDNVNFSLSSSSARQFRLFVYDPAYKVPDWAGGGVMYHIFVDRFFRGEGKVHYRPDSELNENWEKGKLQYAEMRGGNVKNNVFFGGNLWGAAEKLPYLSSLGVSVIYLSPIFDAYSNHKYDTSDYLHVDEGFGGDKALQNLLDKAHQLGIRVILDGVFNHTGDDSVYFDAYGRYGLPASDEKSPYHNWFYFFTDADGKTDYESWWGIKILPKLNLRDDGCRNFLVGQGGVVEKYIKEGVDGWRLDVADELPDEFLDELRRTARRADPDSFIVGEVWENAADKVSYGKRRKYFRGGQLDSVMNYPLRTALIDFAQRRDAYSLGATLTELWSSYPPQVCAALMNIIGTHDTERILSVLGDPAGVCQAKMQQSNVVLDEFRLGERGRRRGMRLLRVISAIQYTVFGFPCVYYGDETGMEGLGDPFCRRPMNWSSPDEELLRHYRRLGKIRRENPVFDGGDFRLRRTDGGYIEFEREKDGVRIVICANLDEKERILDVVQGSENLITGRKTDSTVTVPAEDFVIIREKAEE